jgi:hypothetical protein
MKRHWITPLVMGVAVVATLALVSDQRPASAEGEFAYTSQRGCKKCHFKTHRSWKKTVHANAMDILKPGERADVKTEHGLDPQKDYTKDPVCLGCHTTGYGKPGGYPEVSDSWTDDQAKAAKNNAGVGCEACHGPGEKYSEFKADHEDYKREDIAKMGMIVPVTADTCTKCHQAEGNPTVGDSYTFNFEEAKAKTEAIHEHVELKHEH